MSFRDPLEKNPLAKFSKALEMLEHEAKSKGSSKKFCFLFFFFFFRLARQRCFISLQKLYEVRLTISRKVPEITEFAYHAAAANKRRTKQKKKKRKNNRETPKWWKYVKVTFQFFSFFFFLFPARDARAGGPEGKERVRWKPRMIDDACPRYDRGHVSRPRTDGKICRSSRLPT